LTSQNEKLYISRASKEISKKGKKKEQLRATVFLT
jgi:hypothetical protein